MAQNNGVNELAYLFRAARKSRPLLLLGAGASYRSGIPLAAEAVKHIARAAYARHELGVDAKSHTLTTSDWLPYLQQQRWFVADPRRLADNFPLAVQYLLHPREFRREFFREMIRPPNGISEGYRHLAAIVMRRLCWTILTPNFDSLIVDALRERHVHIPEIVEVNRTADDLVQFNIYNRCQVVYLHGAVEYYRDKNLIDETTRLDEKLIKRLRPLLNDSPLVVVGYRGGEPSIINHLLEEGIGECGGYRHGIFWCVRRGGGELHENVQRLKGKIGDNLRLIEIDGFDELFAALDLTLEGEAYYAGTEIPDPPPGRIPSSQAFEHKPAEGVTVADLDHDLILATLTDYCSRLKLPPVDQHSCSALLREQGLLVRREDHLVPTVACYLLFGRNVTDRFPQACVSFTHGGRKRVVFDGNLITQYRKIVEHLTSEEVSPNLRIKGERTAEERPAYPQRALVELTVNLLVHRDYSVSEPGRIEFDLGRHLRFTNPGGLMPQVYRQVHVDQDGSFQPVRNATEMRNALLADIFYGLGPMDKAGSGLPDVQDMMLESGGRAEFSVGGANEYVSVILFQPVQATPEKSRVARRVSPTEVYVTNLLPFRVVPERLFVLPLRARPLADAPLFEKEELPWELPLFITHGDQLLSFSDLRRFPAFAERRGYLDRLTSPPVGEYLCDQDRRRLFVWLVGKHWEFFLHRWKKQGLYVEYKKKRAYFQLVEGDRNTIRYDSRLRKGVRRDVVKQRGEGKYIEYENEGVCYNVVEFGGTWAIQLKPFYMFTKSDGCTPLPSFVRTRRATRRMKFDRNKSVDDDLTFWARLLSVGQPIINIGGVGVENLILDSEYCSVEVPSRSTEGTRHENAA